MSQDQPLLSEGTFQNLASQSGFIIDIGEFTIKHSLPFDSSFNERLKTYLQNFYTQVITSTKKVSNYLQTINQFNSYQCKPSTRRFRIGFDKQFNQVILYQVSHPSGLSQSYLAPQNEYTETFCGRNEQEAQIKKHHASQDSFKSYTSLKPEKSREPLMMADEMSKLKQKRNKKADMIDHKITAMQQELSAANLQKLELETQKKLSQQSQRPPYLSQHEPPKAQVNSQNNSQKPIQLSQSVHSALKRPQEEVILKKPEIQVPPPPEVKLPIKETWKRPAKLEDKPYQVPNPYLTPVQKKINFQKVETVIPQKVKPEEVEIEVQAPQRLIDPIDLDEQMEGAEDDFAEPENSSSKQNEVIQPVMVKMTDSQVQSKYAIAQKLLDIKKLLLKKKLFSQVDVLADSEVNEFGESAMDILSIGKFLMLEQLCHKFEIAQVSSNTSVSQKLSVLISEQSALCKSKTSSIMSPSKILKRMVKKAVSETAPIQFQIAEEMRKEDAVVKPEPLNKFIIPSVQTPKKKGGKNSAKKSTPTSNQRPESMIPKKRTASQAKRQINIRQNESVLTMEPSSQQSQEEHSVAPLCTPTPSHTSKPTSHGLQIVSKKVARMPVNTGEIIELE